MRAVRFGIVGAGYIAGAHSAAYLAAGGTFPGDDVRAELVAVADSDRARATALQSAWGWGRVEREWQSVTRADDLDVVAVCVPNALHAAVAIDALEHGKHVICEKPLADDVTTASAMHAAAASAGRLAQVCFYYRLWPAVAWATQLVRNGEIGQVRHFRGWMLQDYAAAPTHELGWRAEAGAGNGALGDLGSHIIDIARCLCGEIAAVSAAARRLRGASDPIDAASMLVDFDGGASGVIEASWAMPGHRCDLGFDLIGEQGAIRFAWERANEIHVLSGDVDDPANGFRKVLIGASHPGASAFAGVPGQGLGFRDAFTIGVGSMLVAIGQGAQHVAPSFADGLAAAQVVAAAASSSGTRAWTAIKPSRAP